MNQETNSVSNILTEINKTINAIGAERLIEILKYSRKSNFIMTEEQSAKASLIIQIVCEEFNITLEDFFSSDRQNNKRYAIGICSIFLQNDIGIDNTEISHILKKTQSVTSAYKNDVLRLKSSHPQDAKILNKIDNIKNKFNTLEDGIQ